jgi:NADP-dependent 3-hydroxy acid dehydrogenase YdfG
MNKLKKQSEGLIYENSLKIAVAREYLTSDLGFSKLGAKYGLSGDTVEWFVKWYKTRYPKGVVPEEATVPKQSETDKALKEANLKIAALEMLIENAGKELGIDLVKKLGTKQSGK